MASEILPVMCCFCGKSVEEAGHITLSSDYPRPQSGTSGHPLVHLAEHPIPRLCRESDWDRPLGVSSANGEATPCAECAELCWRPDRSPGSQRPTTGLPIRGKMANRSRHRPAPRSPSPASGLANSRQAFRQ